MSKVYEYRSVFAQPIQNYITQKRALGMKYDKESKIFYELDRFILANSVDTPVFSKELVEAWTAHRSNEKRKNQRYRLNFTKRFIFYLLQNGYSAYMPTVKITTRDDREFVPYIFSKEELAKLFAFFDNMPSSRQYPHGHLVIPLLFRTLVCCGLRVSEVTKLKVGDVDLERGVLLIMEAKNDKRRYVPLSESLWLAYRDYACFVHANADLDKPFFPNARNNFHSTNSIYSFFREALWHCQIPHRGRGYGPRVHDLRHTFAVHCMRKFENDGKDIVLSLPYLSLYMGHCNMNQTQKYLRLVADCYPEVLEKQCGYLGETIPVMEEME